MLDDFTEYLRSQDRSPATVKGYVADLTAFAAWFEQSSGDRLTPPRLTPTDVRGAGYRLSVEKAVSADFWVAPRGMPYVGVIYRRGLQVLPSVGIESVITAGSRLKTRSPFPEPLS